MKKLAIIGAAAGQLPLCLKAKQMGIETYCFAWPQGAVCKDFVDYFIPVSISEMDDIVQYCQKYNIDGVVSNASETTAIVASYVADKLGKVCTSYESLKNIQNKAYVREKTNNIPGLSKVRYNLGKFDYIFSTFPRPYVLKPVFGSAKKGINYIDNSVEKLDLPEELNDATFMAETYIPGKEYSVESISYKGEHHVIQVTEKISTGAPHFVELGHHQPAIIPLALREKIELLICKILSELNFTNGATHIEIKISETGDIYLIEVNPRGPFLRKGGSLTGLPWGPGLWDPRQKEGLRPGQREAQAQSCLTLLLFPEGPAFRAAFRGGLAPAAAHRHAGGRAVLSLVVGAVAGLAADVAVAAGAAVAGVLPRAGPPLLVRGTAGLAGLPGPRPLHLDPRQAALAVAVVLAAGHFALQTISHDGTFFSVRWGKFFPLTVCPGEPFLYQLPA